MPQTIHRSEHQARRVGLLVVVEPVHPQKVQVEKPVKSAERNVNKWNEHHQLNLDEPPIASQILIATHHVSQ